MLNFVDKLADTHPIIMILVGVAVARPISYFIPPVIMLVSALVVIGYAISIEDEYED